MVVMQMNELLDNNTKYIDNKELDINLEFCEFKYTAYIPKFNITINCRSRESVQLVFAKSHSTNSSDVFQNSVSVIRKFDTINALSHWFKLSGLEKISFSQGLGLQYKTCEKLCELIKIYEDGGDLPPIPQ